MFADTDLMKDKKGQPYCPFALEQLEALEAKARLQKRTMQGRRLDRSERHAIADAA